VTKQVPAIILWDQAYNRNGDKALPRAAVNALRTHIDNDTLTGWAKAETLASYTGLSVRMVRRQIAQNVEAGWLEVVRSGNSSGLANTYRLTYPNGVMDDRVRPERVSSSTGKGVMDVTPTTHRTSPQGKFSRGGTTQETGVVNDTLPAEPSGSGDIGPAYEATESEGVADDTLPDHLEAQLEAWERRQAAEDRLLVALREKPIGGKEVYRVAGVDVTEAKELCLDLIARGLVIHDMAPGPRRNTLRLP
jgi:hypothetical protein